MINKMIGELLTNTVICGDTLDSIKRFPDASIDCIITSPPYYQLRDYGYSEQWGLEKTYQEYLDKMILFMAECKRVIKDSGSIWVNLGDSYSGNKEGNDDPKLNDAIRKSGVSKKVTDIPSKSLMLIPHRFAIRPNKSGKSKDRPDIYGNGGKRLMPVNFKFKGYTDCGCNVGFSGGIIVDPFAGTGTTLVRALQLNRQIIGIEGSKEYSDIAKKNIDNELIKHKLF